MSFLDATGLGTFWAKLKNYFVPGSKFEAPVNGDLNNVITPENLWKNSIFYPQTSIYPITNPKEFTITNNSFNNQAYFTDDIRLSSSGISEGTISVEIANQSIIVSGTITTFRNGDDRWISIVNPYVYVSPYNYYTESAKLVSSSSSYCSLQSSANTSTSNMYNVLAAETNEKAVRVFKPSLVANPRIMIIFDSNTPNNFEFSVSFTEPCLYEGKFLNPGYHESQFNYNIPSIRSLQVIMGSSYKTLSLTSAKRGWHRLFKFIRMDTSIGPSVVAKLYISKGFGYSLYERYFVTASTCASYNKGYIDVQCFKGTGSPALSKFRIIKDSETNEYHLEGYYNQSGNDDFFITVRDICDNKDLTTMFSNLFANGYNVNQQYCNRYAECFMSLNMDTVIAENSGTVLKEVTTTDKYSA